MNLIAPIAALLGIEAKGLVDQARKTAISYALIALFLLTAAGFALAAGYMLLADALSPLMAALIISGIFLLLALAVYAGYAIGNGRQERIKTDRRKSSETGALITTAALTALPAILRSPGILRFGLPAAAVAVFLMLRDDSNED